VEQLETLITEKTRIVCVAHISNVLGLVNPVKEISDICRKHGVMLLVDGAQGVVHQKVDVQALGCDFYAFSGHKMYGAPGTGVLWGRRSLLEQMPPMFGGGEMIETVRWDGSTWAPLPRKFEAGTQNISGTPCFVQAIETLRSIPQDDGIRDYVYDALQSIDGLRLFGTTDDRSLKIPVFSFYVEHAHHEDLALILDKMGIAVRSGQMCAEPLMDRYGVTGMLRASFAPYNTMQEAEYFVSSLRKAIGMLR
jgi:cysteine desulfurase/selenocysteine lyase